MIKEFNIVITGIGGQGILTLSKIIAEAAFLQGYDVKTSELHGLAQRGGTIPCHVRFGKKIFSPIVREGEANLIIGLEPLETLRACYYGSKENKTVFLFDTEKIVPISVSILKEKYPSIEEIKNLLKPFAHQIIDVNASEIVKRETGTTLGKNVFLLGCASCANLIPIERKFLFEGMKKIIKEKYFEMNKKIFDLGCRTKI